MRKLNPVSAVSPAANLGVREGWLDRAKRHRLLASTSEFLTVGAFGFLPFALPAFLAVYVLHNASWGNDGSFYDLHTTWVAGRNIAHGHSPYPFIYPAPAAVVMVPFGILPWRLAVVAFFLMSTAAVFVTLRILGVRDWRCYGACLVALPTASAIWIGTPTPLLALATACVWRWRDRRFVLAIALVAAVATKIFLWPLFVWLLAMRRFRAAVIGSASIAIAVVGAWALIGFVGVTTYPKQLADAASMYEDKGYSVISFVHALGMHGVASNVAAGIVALFAIGAVVLLARGPNGDVASFTVAIAAALLTSPIVWVHYLLLLYVPIAIVRPRLSGLWLLPLLLWPLGGQESHGSLARLLFVLGLLLIWAVWVVRSGGSRQQAGPRLAFVPAPARLSP